MAVTMIGLVVLSGGAAQAQGAPGRFAAAMPGAILGAIPDGVPSMVRGATQRETPEAAQRATLARALAPLVVRNDRGGSLVARLRQIRGLRATGQAVQITGRVCYSTCTMFLGLPQTCISPQTMFGFHAPDRPGRPLSPEDFDYASRVIAEYYPAPLKRWYLREGRYRKSGLHKITGANLIALGVQKCPGA